jgi:hypothetical protein
MFSSRASVVATEPVLHSNETMFSSPCLLRTCRGPESATMHQRARRSGMQNGSTASDYPTYREAILVLVGREGPHGLRWGRSGHEPAQESALCSDDSLCILR